MNDSGQCLAVCRECTEQTGRPCVQPFGSHTGLETWRQRHVNDTAHQVQALDGWPSPNLAWMLTFGGTR